MRLSLIINTACLDPYVAAAMSRYAHVRYGERAHILRERILPEVLADGWDEIFVVGCFEPGEGYTYVAMDPIYRDRRDALWQRELGARKSNGDVLAFSHDDHLLPTGTVAEVRNMSQEWDILVPQRRSMAGMLLNNGAEDGYMGGHSLLMKRALWAHVPWTAVDTEWWDLSLTRVWREEGARIIWTDAICHIDMEQEG